MYNQTWVAFFFSTDDNTPTPIVENSSKGKIYFDGRRRKRRSLTEKKELERFEEDEMYKQFVGQAEGHRNFLRNDARYESFFLFFFLKERFLWSVVKFLVNSRGYPRGLKRNLMQLKDRLFNIGRDEWT